MGPVRVSKSVFRKHCSNIIKIKVLFGVHAPVFPGTPFPDNLSTGIYFIDHVRGDTSISCLFWISSSFNCFFFAYMLPGVGHGVAIGEPYKIMVQWPFIRTGYIFPYHIPIPVELHQSLDTASEIETLIGFWIWFGFWHGFSWLGFRNTHFWHWSHFLTGVAQDVTVFQQNKMQARRITFEFPYMYYVPKHIDKVYLIRRHRAEEGVAFICLWGFVLDQLTGAAVWFIGIHRVKRKTREHEDSKNNNPFFHISLLMILLIDFTPVLCFPRSPPE